MALNYTKTNWVNNQTKLNADNMNNIEDGIKNASEECNSLNGDLSALWNSPSEYSPFQKAGYLENGNILDGNFRIASTNIIHATNDIDVRIDSGRRIGIHTFDENGNFIADSGWHTNSYFIPKDSYFRMIISAFSETIDEEFAYTADVETLVGYVRFNHIADVVKKISTKVSENESKIIGINEKLGEKFDVSVEDFESGTYYGSSMTADSDSSVIRMSNKKTYHIRSGFAISGNNKILFRLYKRNGSAYSLVEDANYVSSYNVTSDSDYCFVVKYSNSAAITDISECLSHLSIKSSGVLDELKEEIYKSNENSALRYPFKINISTEEITRGLSSYDMQGGAINGNTLFYGITKDNTNATIVKYDLSTNTEIASIEGAYGHAGDMTYNKNTDELIIINGKDNQSDIFVLDPTTLALKNTLYVPYKLGAIAYNPLNNGYVLEICENGVFWNDYKFMLVDSNFETIITRDPVKNGYLMQGIECDGKFIYALYANPNRIFVYDMGLRYIGYHNVDFSTESEFIAKYDDETFYLSENSNKSIFKAKRTFEWN